MLILADKILVRNLLSLCSDLFYNATKSSKWLLKIYHSFHMRMLNTLYHLSDAFNVHFGHCVHLPKPHMFIYLFYIAWENAWANNVNKNKGQQKNWSGRVKWDRLEFIEFIGRGDFIHPSLLSYLLRYHMIQSFCIEHFAIGHRFPSTIVPTFIYESL